MRTPLSEGHIFFIAALPRGEPVTGVILRDLGPDRYTSFAPEGRPKGVASLTSLYTIVGSQALA